VGKRKLRKEGLSRLAIEKNLLLKYIYIDAGPIHKVPSLLPRGDEPPFIEGEEGGKKIKSYAATVGRVQLIQLTCISARGNLGGDGTYCPEKGDCHYFESAWVSLLRVRGGEFIREEKAEGHLRDTTIPFILKRKKKQLTVLMLWKRNGLSS